MHSETVKPVGGIELAAVRTPDWLAALVEAVVPAVVPLAHAGPLGCRWWQPSPLTADRWVVHVFPAPAELHGGHADGACVVAYMRVSVHLILKLFSEVDAVHWYSVRERDDVGPAIEVIGVFVGHPVKLLLCQMPPHDELPAVSVDTASGVVTRKD